MCECVCAIAARTDLLCAVDGTRADKSGRCSEGNPTLFIIMWHQFLRAYDERLLPAASVEERDGPLACLIKKDYRVTFVIKSLYFSSLVLHSFMFVRKMDAIMQSGRGKGGRRWKETSAILFTLRKTVYQYGIL